jgi:hypothetical protein
MKDVNKEYLSKFVYNYDYNMLAFYSDYGIQCYGVHHRIAYLDSSGNFIWRSRLGNGDGKRINRFVKNKWVREHDGNNVIMLPNNY